MLPPRGLSAGALVLLVGACTQQGGAGGAGAAPTRVRVAELSEIALLDDTQPLVVAHIPGFGDATLLIDTGAEFSWIDAAFAARAGLSREPLDATLVDIHGVESGIAERARIDRLELGGLVVTDFKPPLLRTLREDVHGAVGQDLLRMAEVVLDGPGRRLFLIPKGTWDAAIRVLFQPGNVALGYAVEWTRDVPVIRVPVGELEGEHAFQVDTGSGPMTVTRGLAGALGLESLGTEVGVGLSHGLPVVETWAIRDLELQALVVSDDAHEAPENRLGWGVLSKLVTVFVNSDDRMLLFPSPTWAAQGGAR